MYLDNNSTFNIGDGSTLDVQADVTIQHYDSNTSAVVVAGTLEKTQGDGTTFDIPVDNSGTIDVSSGVINLDDGGSIAAGASFAGSGTTWFGGGTVTLGGNATAANLGLSGGTLTGAGNLDVSSTFQWTGGTLAGTGTLALGPGAQMSMAGAGPVDPNGNPVGLVSLTSGGQTVESSAPGSSVTWSAGLLTGTLNVTHSTAAATAATATFTHVLYAGGGALVVLVVLVAYCIGV